MVNVAFYTYSALFVLLQAGAGDDDLPSASEYVARGMQRFRANKIEGSVRDFERAAKLQPSIAPRLWQRGISDYYAGQFKHGRDVFESHKSVNPYDVENAAWHFLCVAKLEGLKASRKMLIKIDTSRDKRVPMAHVYELYAGRGSEKEVLEAAALAGTESARMYANLYLALYCEVADRPKEAKKFMLQAAAAKLKDHYMHDVAKVHVLQRKWK